MRIHISRPSTSLLLTTFAAFLIPAASLAQQPTPAPPAANPDAVKLFHPAPPLPSYEVATIKKADPNAAAPTMARTVGGGGPRPGQRFGSGGQTIQSYILNAYGASTRSQGQLVGGPAWLSTDQYVIEAKVPDDLRDATQKMTLPEQNSQTRSMQQALLADRFHLKAHFETRQLPVFELTAAKGGLKFKPLQPSTPGAPASPAPIRPGGPPMPAGMTVSMPKPGGGRLVSMHAMTMSTFIDFLRRSPEINGKPILDRTGFNGTFDVNDLDWSVGSADATDPVSLFTSITENLGLKLTATKGPVEVLVIDSIDRPTEN